MHLLEQYALSSGLKIGKPFIYEVFFPIESKKYICFHPNSKFDSKNYDYWQLVIDLIFPILQKNGIDIIQIGGQNEKAYANCIHTQGIASINQTAYIIKKSILNLGADSFSAHVASGFGKKIVAIYSTSNINNCKPYWSNPEDVTLLEPDRSNKPSYSGKENPKTINSIKPEMIANSALELLGLEDRVKIKTLFIGEDFSDSISFGFLPNQVVLSSKFTPDIRMDLFFDEKNLADQLSKQKSTITTKKEISYELLSKFKANIAKIVYIIEENDNPDFVKFLFENGFSFSCVSRLNPEKLNLKKINYYRFSNINEYLETEKEKEFKTLYAKLNASDIFFKSNYIISSDKNSYLSEQHMLENEPVKDSKFSSFERVKNSDIFLSEIKNFWIIEKT